MSKHTQKIGLGTAQFGTDYGISNRTGQTSHKEAREILEVAKANHITIIDTAPAYGNAEKVLGQNNLSAFKIVSKFMPPGKKATISDQLYESLYHLGAEKLYGYLAHRPEQLLKNPGQWEELHSLKEKGKVEKTGFSLNRPEELENLLNANIKPDLIQVPFNYFDQRFKDLMISLKNEGCEIHTRSAFLQGLFFMEIGRLDSYFDEVKPAIDYLQKNVKNLPGALLSFVLSQPFVDTVIIGVENRKQFIQNIESIRLLERLPDLEDEIPESIVIPSNWPKIKKL